MLSMQELINYLNAPIADTRLEALRRLMNAIREGDLERPVTTKDVNNHIHSTYSFSPYSPTKGLWMAYNAGLSTAGIMDHDTISGAEEFITAGQIIGIATTVGLECRCKMAGTPLADKRINNPDQKGIAYVAVHGIPHTQIERVKTYLKPYLDARNIRNKKMIVKINEIMEPYGIELDFELHVRPSSMNHEGGSITERHILFSLAKKLTQQFGMGIQLVGFLKNKLGIPLSDKVEEYLTNPENPHYLYDLLGALKSEMVSQFYIDADEECPPVRELVGFAKEIGAISAYAYLGDVGDSVTGDKKTQKFEDDYIDLLFETIKDIGFNAVTYMPSRNTAAQLNLIRHLCDEHGLFQISGVDINSSRQQFVCEAQRAPEFSNLYDATWALIGHERVATKNLEDAMFSDKIIAKYPDLRERIEIYKAIGLGERIKP